MAFLISVTLLIQQPMAQASEVVLDKIQSLISCRDASKRRELFNDYAVNRNGNKIAVHKILLELVSIAENDDSDEGVGFSPRKIALYVLADNVDYNSDVTIARFLVKHTNVFFSGKDTVRGIDTAIDKSYPAIRGLLRIGQTATEPIIQKIISTDDVGTHGRLAFWFCKYYGQKPAEKIIGDLLNANQKMPLIERKRLVHVLEFIEINTW